MLQQPAKMDNGFGLTDRGNPSPPAPLPRAELRIERPWFVGPGGFNPMGVLVEWLKS